MDITVPDRPLSKEEINRCYLRWQQLRNEHGENAPNVPEFIYFTKILQTAAKQQQQQELRQRQQSNSQPDKTTPQELPNASHSAPQNVDNSQLPLSSQGQQQLPLNPVNNSSPLAENAAIPNGSIHSSSMNQQDSMSSAYKSQNGAMEDSVRSPTSQNPNNNIASSISHRQSIATSPKTVDNSRSNAHISNLQSHQAHLLQQAQLAQQAQLSQQTPLTQQTQHEQQTLQKHTNIFTQEQSDLLKAQIGSLKCLVNHQPVPFEYQNVIQKSMNNPPDFRKMLMTLGEYVRTKQQQKPAQAIGNPQQVPPSQSQSQVNKPQGISPPVKQKDEKKQSNKISAGVEENDLNKNIRNNGPVNDNKSVREESKMTQIHTNTKQHIEKQNKKNQIDQQPPKPVPPVPVNVFRNLHPSLEKVIDIEDADIMVDSFTLPTLPESPIDYNSLFPTSQNPKLNIQPGILPDGVDVHAAAEIYQTLVALNLDTAVDDCLTKTLDESTDDKTKEDALYDYYALQLLPLQKAVRGHLLQFEWYQNSLLTNTHPNFLSKIRNINIQDTFLTNELYKKHELLHYKKQQKERTVRLAAIANSSIVRFNERIDRRHRRIKFGGKLVTLHGNLEKDEQKRQERKAKERLQALKANDEEAYIKLLDQTKDTRITHLLKQTNAFLDSLTKAVKDQQKYTKDMIESHINEDSEGPEGSMPNEPKYEDDEEEQENIDYYNVAHKIKEEITQQPTILVGGTLKEYQLKGLQWMVSLFNNHLNGILADEMGLGKTIQTISLLTHLYEAKNVHGPFLVIVPLSTLSNWSNEFIKWAPTLRTIAYKGSPAERKSKQSQVKAGEFDVLLTTFEYIIKEKAILSKVKWVHMIIDEGHRMKNAQSKLSLTLNTFYHSDYRLILTGTPLQNNLPELWALLNFVLPKIFNSVKSFDEWFNTPFANTGGQDKIELSEEETLLVIRRLHKVLRPFLLRRLKKDVESELPDKVEVVIKCKMSGLQETLYQQMLKHRRLFVGDHTNKKMVGLRGFNNQIMQLKKICNHPFVFEEVEDQVNPTRETNLNIWRVAGKFELLQRVLPKLKATNHRVLIFFQMTQIMDIMEDFLRLMDIKYLRLDGHTKSDDRSQLLKLFNAPDSEYFCFILSTRAGGLGLNLQTADTVIIFDTDWNPHQDLQAQDRAHRIGQKNEVRILRLITEHSVEEVILERAHKKLDIDGKVIQAGKFDNKSTSEEQEALLRSLLEAEEERKKRISNGIEEEEEEFGDNRLNELLARNDDEMGIFSKIDSDRNEKDKEVNLKSRLMEKAELPSIYSQDIGAELEREESEAAAQYSGRGTRERKRTTYSDISEAQWLKQFELSDDDEDKKAQETPSEIQTVEPSGIIDEQDEFFEELDEESRKRKINKHRIRQKKLKLDEDEDSNIPTSPSIRDELQNEAIQTTSPSPEIEPNNTHTSTTSGKTSIKSARTSTRGRGRGKARGRIRGRGRGRGRPPKTKNGLQYLRIPSNTVPVEEREKISEKVRLLYNYVLEYTNVSGRKLSDIFLIKPPRSVYPDYYLLIKYPVALEDINNHIETLAFTSVKEVLEDFHLVFANARVYNTEDSLVYQDSLELEDKIIEKYREITGDANPIDFSEFDQVYTSSPLVVSTAATTTGDHEFTPNQGEEEDTF
ncbi:hypothetical protein KAFR_0B03370 [Kazachstania africana CBS 2517]|uniref:Transcription regulatory protein SNF2 n=1 Tax=Kazachstania africana (strain ATCC 22294 / BCRC 22015 / CBS 2517 / CECT 1963 / NBRC 1671 / NRRL Y-8276) TaxID=1071382 RepID=H2AQI4_KAZAF|nr:hypothetical protein KAFR_0B03370 [Kazachstania africana CBS 2517]CCF56634.1 hypothetical protein KAFR_0B03370 [Kazachstania africana CBS 2517]